MPTPAAETQMTAEQLLDRSSELGRCELIKGELRRMSPAGGTHGEYVSEISFYIGSFVKQHQLGKVYAAETGFVLERQPDTVRAPDVAFIAADRAAEARTPQYIPIPPDLAVEVTSPHDRSAEVVEKVRWWLSHGTRAVWVVEPKSRTLTVYLPDSTARIYGRDETLDGGPVLPGFALPLSELFTD